MPITPEAIHTLAAEARLKITQDEMHRITQYMNDFLTKLEQMNELELKDIPLFDFAEVDSCPVREDSVVKYQYRDDILADAPDRDGNYYRAARILEE